MFRKKQDFPEESELVLCTVTSVQHHSVFVKIEDYGLSGMIHISEVSPGRIRNIRDFVKEGKVIVCKVLRVNKERGQVDLSLRRVTESQRRNKVEELKQEQKSEKIIESVAKKLKKEPQEVYDTISKPVLEKYESIFQAFQEVVMGNLGLEELEIPAVIAKELMQAIAQRMKPPEVSIKGTLSLTSYAPNGVEIIKKALQKATSTTEKTSITYKGGGKYAIIVTAPDYKTAEKRLSQATAATINLLESEGGTASFERA